MAAPMVRNCVLSGFSFRLNFHGFRELCTSLPNFARPHGHLWSTEFWDRFYEKKKSKETSFDWFLSYESLKNHILPILEDSCTSGRQPIKVLDIGSGTSDFALRLYESSSPPVHQITCVDFSELATRQMSSVHRLLKPRDATSPGVSYITGDVRKLNFENGSFDMIFDKGTTDAVVRGPRGEETFGDVFKECSRLLEDDRTWVQVSDAPPEDRLDLLERHKLSGSGYENSSFQISYKDLGTHFGIEYFMYLIYKSSRKRVAR